MTDRNNETRLDDDFLEKLIIKSILIDKQFAVLVSRAFKKDYFVDAAAGEIFRLTANHIEEHNTLPPRNIIENTVEDGIRSDIENFFTEIDQIDFSVEQQYNYLVNETNEYLKEQAVKQAILKSVDIVESRDNRELIRQQIEEALTKDLKIDLGLNYFEELGERLRRIFTSTDIRVPSYFPQFDEFLSGGFPALTLSVLVAKIHGFKSNIMTNFASRQVLHGHNVVMLSLEMSQDMNAQRLDSIYSLMDINAMYFGENRRILQRKLSELKQSTQDRGQLYLKHFPTGAASVKDFRVYLRELIIRGLDISIIYVDYINLMKSAYKRYGDLYSSVKSVAEELRALSFEFEVPIISVSQLNREGSFVGFGALDFNYIAESMGLPATADFMSIMGTDPDSLTYENELHYKIVKNRLGGRVSEIDKFFYDKKTLKMYDSLEQQMWENDALTSLDDRNIAPPPEESNNEGRRGRR